LTRIFGVWWVYQEKTKAEDNQVVQEKTRSVEELKSAVQTGEKEIEALKRELETSDCKLAKVQVINQPDSFDDAILKEKKSEIDRVKAETAALSQEETRLKAALAAAAQRNQEASRNVQQVLVKRYKLQSDAGADGHYELSSTLKK
jgi:hypothetical protein